MALSSKGLQAPLVGCGLRPTERPPGARELKLPPQCLVLPLFNCAVTQRASPKGADPASRVTRDTAPLPYPTIHAAQNMHRNKSDCSCYSDIYLLNKYLPRMYTAGGEGAKGGSMCFINNHEQNKTKQQIPRTHRADILKTVTGYVKKCVKQVVIKAKN